MLDTRYVHLHEALGLGALWLHPKRLPKPRRRPSKSSLHPPCGTTRRLSAMHIPNPNRSPNPPHNQRPNSPNAAIFHGPNRPAPRACWF